MKEAKDFFELVNGVGCTEAHYFHIVRAANIPDYMTYHTQTGYRVYFQGHCWEVRRFEPTRSQDTEVYQFTEPFNGFLRCGVEQAFDYMRTATTGSGPLLTCCIGTVPPGVRQWEHENGPLDTQQQPEGLMVEELEGAIPLTPGEPLTIEMEIEQEGEQD